MMILEWFIYPKVGYLDKPAYMWPTIDGYCI